VRAGLIEAPVAGATGMIAAKTTRPMASPANRGEGAAVDDAEDRDDEDEGADELDDDAA
jgi:hypothetical protein